MIDFIEGKISFEDFFIEYKNNEKIIFYIQKEALKNNSWYYKIEDLDKMDLSRLKVRSGFATTIMHYLDTRKINYSLDNKDIKTYRELSKYLPAWLDFDDCDIIHNVINSIEENQSQTNKRKEIRDMLLSIFKYEKRPPRWLQNPEWPIVDGKPALFISQDGDPNDLTKDVITYFFSDVASNEKIIVVQTI